MKRLLITICVVVGMLLTVNVDVKAVIAPSLWLQFEGPDGQTTTVDSSANAHTIALLGTPAPQAQLDTDYHAVGAASLLLDGSNDYATAAPTTSPDWDICASNTDNWTISFYVRLDTHAGTTGLMYQGTDASNRWAIRNVHGNGLLFSVMSSASDVISTGYGREITDSDWHWIALCKIGDGSSSRYALYNDGNQANYTSDPDTRDFTGLLNIGRTSGPGTSYYYTDGNMDEVMIYHDNVFGANPNSDKTDHITNIPEPATIALLGLGALSLLRRKRSV
ncbi:MAG: LamG-like jellyroll fold domain-containing protein [Sedimentisphaerales bacterium]